MDKEVLYSIIDSNDSLDSSTADMLRQLTEEFPFFETARLLYTKHLQNSDEEKYVEELGRSAVLCSDRKRLFYILQPDRYNEFLGFTDQDTNNEDRTDEIIDAYFKSFETEVSEKPLIESGMSIVSTDYFSYLESLGTDTTDATEPGKSFQHQDIIDAFLEKNDNNSFHIQHNQSFEQTSTVVDESDESSEFLTETLANIYIKQKKYEQALTIIRRLSLNFPKKSAYFADQIRFLEFLIINDKK